MSVRTGIVLLLALSTLSLLVACGSSGNTNAVPPPSGGFSNSNLSGTYVFSVSGTDFNGAPFAIVGTIMPNGQGGNGQGTIEGGTIDIVDAEYTPAFALTINSNGFYSVGVDGRGTATIGTSTANPFGANMTFDFVLQDSSHGLITEFDGNATGSGTLDAQTSGLTQSSLAGPYAFSFSGADGTTGYPLATVGGFTLDQNGNITASSGAEDFNDANLAYADYTLTGQVILGPSGTPTTVLDAAFGPLQFDVYAIDSTHLKFIESDSLEFLSGDAFSQTSASIPTGTLAFTLSGFLPFSAESANPFAAGGFMVTAGSGSSGNITSASSEDENNGGSPSPAPFSFTASYSNSGSAIPGRFTLSNFDGFQGGGIAPQYAAYPSSGGTLLLEIDDAGILSGVAYPPQSSTAFTPPQGFGLNFTGINLSAGVEVDDIAEFSTTATTCNSSSATFCGLDDENFDPSGGPTPKQIFDGTFTAPDSNGRGLIATTTVNNTEDGEPAFTFYSVDGSTFPFIEVDANGQVATGVFELQDASASAGAIVGKSHLFIPRPLVHSRAVRALNRQSKQNK